MIITVDSTLLFGVQDFRVVEVESGAEVDCITKVDTTTGEAWGYQRGADGKWMMDPDGDSLAIFSWPNKVRVEVRG